jgi:putative addiction module component (TIGR02574 family)
MAPDAQEILDAALKLNDQEKAAIAASLIESLDPNYDEGCDEAWAHEIAKRMRDLDSGQVKTIPWSEARRMILQPGNDTESD